MLRLPLWVSVWAVAILAFAIFRHRRNVPPVSEQMRRVLAICSVGVTILYFALQGLNLDAGVAVVVMMCSFKALELRTKRDAFSAIVLSLFILMFELLHGGGLFSSAYAFGVCFTIIAGLIQLNAPMLGFRAAAREALRLVAPAIPIMIVLFIIFPRLPAGLFGIRSPGQQSGFSDTLKPGDLSSIALNTDVAFRVDFAGSPPPQHKLYWRGLVLWIFDGEQWKQAERVPEGVQPFFGENLVKYTLQMEPHGEFWVFALDMPLAGSAGASIRADFTIQSMFRLSGRRRLFLSAFTTYNTGNLLHGERDVALQLPRSGNAKTRAMAEQWAKETAHHKDIVLRMLDYFREKPFYYTLNPVPTEGEQAKNAIDEFLFENRKGFCAHYASAFTFFMRAAGVPARLVVGYQGGVRNPVAGYYIVRQSEAHAWCEVWLEGQGWVRIDPTAAIAPERIEQGLLQALGAQGNQRFLDADRYSGFARSWRGASIWLDTGSYYWGRYVLDYSFWRQRGILADLGLNPGALSSWFKAGAVGVLVLAATIAVVYFVLSWLLSRSDRSLVVREYELFCNRMARIGLERAPFEGPKDYAARIEQSRPDLAEQCEQILHLYAEQRYGKFAGPELFRRLRKMVRAFRPR